MGATSDFSGLTRWACAVPHPDALGPSGSTEPQLPLGRYEQMLVERIGMSVDLAPFAAAGDYRKDSVPGRNDPHIMLQLRHVFLSGRLFGERPRQHEFGLEHRPASLHSAI